MFANQTQDLAEAVQAIIRENGYSEAECRSLCNVGKDGDRLWFEGGVAVMNGDQRHGVRFNNINVTAQDCASELLTWLRER